MADPFIGEIKIVGFNFAPIGWAKCDGQLLPISQNSALFSLYGTYYGGDGRTTFALPDLRGRLAMHLGNGAGLSNRPIGQRSGVETVALNSTNIGSHSHPVSPPADANEGNSSSPQGAVPARTEEPMRPYSNAGSNATMSGYSTQDAGGGQAHENMPPFLVVNFVVALVGTYPSRP